MLILRYRDLPVFYSALKTIHHFKKFSIVKPYFVIFFKMKLSWGLLASSAFGFNERPGQCPEELPNQPDFDVERYLGVWQT